MTLDSSALIAILFAEPGYLNLVDRILTADHVRVGAPTLVETSMLFAGRRGSRSAEEAEWHVAMDAFRRFGRGVRQAGW